MGYHPVLGQHLTSRGWVFVRITKREFRNGKWFNRKRGMICAGLAVAQINPQVIARLGLPFSAKGVVVTDPGRFGARIGLRKGDIISGINRTEIGAPEDVVQALTRPGRRVEMSVLRRGQRLALRFRL